MVSSKKAKTARTAKTAKKNSPRDETRSLLGRLLPLALVAAAVVAGLVLGGLTDDAPAGDPPAAAALAAPSSASTAPDTVTRVRLDLAGAPAFGPPDAPITLVEFIDYQCPFCQRAHRTLDEVLERFKGRVRVVILQNPLSNHKDAPLAAQASLAAAEQGRFREMHDLLLANARNLQRDNLLALAEQIGLDTTAFADALESARHAEQVAANQKQAEKLGATATPYFFINGRELRGAQPLAAFDRIIREELDGNLPPTRWAARVTAPQRSTRPPEDPNKIYTIDTSGSIARGPDTAPVTIVEFTDFECTFCSRAQSTVQRLVETYPDDVRLVVKNLPLSFHGQARPAAIAAMAADRQGRYWEYRAQLFENVRALNEARFVAIARDLGLDIARWEADRRDPALSAVVDRDLKQAAEVGVGGTPTFFVNGKKLLGAQPFATFQAAIEAARGGAGSAAPPTGH